MLTLEEGDIPLFLEANGEVFSYIIDNTFLGAERTSLLISQPYRAFSLLVELYNHDSTREVFPEKIAALLETDFTLPNSFSQDLLVGQVDQGKYHYGISLDMSISKDQLKPVSLSHIRYYHGFKPFTFDCTLTLTPQQAFYLFANILTNSILFHFEYVYYPQELLALSLTKFTENYIQRNKYDHDRFGEAFTIYNQLAFEYLQHLKTILLNKTLTPATLFPLSGATTLGFLRHLPPVENYLYDVISVLKNPITKPSLNQEVLYYTLLYNVANFNRTIDNNRAVDFKPTDDFVYRFLEDKSPKSKNYYSRDIAKPFPISDTMKSLS